MYVCGPTVYDLPHIGHGRYNLVFDVLRRFLLFSGLAVRYVSNVADVDDNIIKQANEQGRERQSRRWPPSSRHAGGRPWILWACSGRTRHPTPRAISPTWWTWWGISWLGVVAYDASDGVWGNVEQVPGYGLLALREPRLTQSRDSRRRQRREAITAGLRLVEEGQGGRAELGSAMGRRPPWLARRVRGDVARPAG